MRRVHLRENILKRVLIHLGGINLSLVMRQLLGKGTPRGLQGLSADTLLAFLRLWIAVLMYTERESTSLPMQGS
jgi:transposase